MASEFFASVPDECPDCASPLDMQMQTRDTAEGRVMESNVSCPDCGYTNTEFATETTEGP